MTEVLKDSTGHSFFFELVDSTTGLPKTGITYSDVTLSYCRTRGARVAITPTSLASASAAYSSGGFILVDDTNQPGIVRVDVPNAVFATGVEEVVVTVKATGCRTVSRSFTLTDISMQTAKVPATIAAGDIATDAIDAASVKADAVTKIQTGLASQTSVDDLPTNAELATALGTADDAVLSAIASLNDITAADAAIAVRTNLATELARIDENISAAKTLTPAYDPAKTAATQSSVDDISDRLPASLTGDGNIKADALKVNGQTPQTIPTLAHFSVG